jgi:hypothetical protein
MEPKGKQKKAQKPNLTLSAFQRTIKGLLVRANEKDYNCP